MKKNIKLLLIACIYLAVCYGIGKYRNSVKSSAENDMNVEIMSDTQPFFENVVFEGVYETADTPWNCNAGIVDLEEEGKGLLLMPNTAVILRDIQGMENLTFSAMIHPWVRKASDGAGLLIWVLDADGNILQEQSVAVSTQDGWESFLISFSEKDKAESIKIFCNNGGNDDDNGDWVVLK